MSFTLYNKSGAAKIYWLLSEYSIKVIESDMKDFDYLLKQHLINTVSRMYNYIFKNYYKYAHCSVAPEWEKDILDDIRGIDDDKKNKIWCKLRSATSAHLYSIIKGKYLCDKGIKQNYRLNSETIEILKNSKMDMIAEIYKDNAGEYFRAVLEEYSHLPMYEREKYLNISVYSRLNNCISEHDDFSKRRPLKVETDTSHRSTHIIYAYKIMPCKNLNHYYLVAVGKGVHGKKPFTNYILRLTHILNAESVYNYQDGLTADELKKKSEEIDALLEKIDVPYIKDEYCDDIKVRFTDDGIKLLHRVVHNRPLHEEPDENNICIFKCTDREIINYLHNFGKDAEVLSPTKIREKLSEFYKHADECYK